MDADHPDDYELLTAALRDFPESLPPEYRDLTLAQVKQLWEDEAHRARLLPALQMLVHAITPGLTEAADVVGAARRLSVSCARLLSEIRSRLRGVAEAVSASARLARALPQVAASYCEPYQRQLAELPGGFPPLTPEEQTGFFVAALLLVSPEEAEAGTPSPLERVALVQGRADIAAAVLWRDDPDLPRRLHSLREEKTEWDSFVHELFVALGDQVLPRLHTRLQELTPQEARGRVADWLTRYYITTAVRHDQLDALREQRALERHETIRLDDSEQAGDIPDPDRTLEDMPDRAAALEAIGQYLAASTRPEVDRGIAEAIAAGISMDQLQHRLNVPARALRYRRDLLLAYCRKSLGLDE